MRSWVKILLGLFLGVVFGLILGPHAEVFRIFGKAFIHLMTMIVVLLIFSSLVVGICNIKDPKKLGRIGLRTFGFYIVSTLIAIAVGATLAHLLNQERDYPLLV